MIGVVGSTAFADQAIAIAHRDVTLAPGEISEFEFVVIMSEAELEEALTAQYYLDYDGADPYALCYEEPEPDTLYAECAGSVDLSITGPMLDAYTWTWTNELTGEEVGTGPTITVTPGGTTHYVVTGEPMGDCFVLPITREVVVVATGVGPNLELTDPGPQCGTFNLDDLVFTDTEGIPDTFVEFYSEFPDSMMDPTDILPPGTEIGPDDEAWILMGDPAGGCYDVEPIIIEFIEISAGLDSTGFEICNSGLEIADLETFLVDTMYIAEGSMWEEVTPTGGAFDPVTLEFDPTDVPAGDYVIRHIALGGLFCENDTSLHTITVYDQPTAGDNNDGVLCNTIGETFDMNTLLIDHDLGGIWEEVTPTGGAFDLATGIFTADGVMAPGDYEFHYIVLGSDPCVNDTAFFDFTLLPLPNVLAGPDQSICDGDETIVNAAGTPGVIYSWEPAPVIDGVPFTPSAGTETYTVTGVDMNGCRNYDSLEIVVHPLPTISFTANDLEGCTPFEVNFILTSDPDPVSIDWIFGDGDIIIGTSSTSVTHTYDFGGVYTVSTVVTDVNGCVNTINYSDYITVYTQPIASFTMSTNAVYTDDTRVIFTNGSLYAVEYIWDFGDGSELNTTTSPTHEFPKDGEDKTYPVELYASNEIGCIDSTIMYLTVRAARIFYIPNTFTPDGDSFNDVFQPVFYSGYDPYDYHLTIFNRWGEIVFESYDSSIGWDGTYGNNGIVQDGVYTWKLDFKDAYNDVRYDHYGHVTVIK
jgi:gliding motility-associated-like protein